MLVSTNPALCASRNLSYRKYVVCEFICLGLRKKTSLLFVWYVVIIRKSKSEHMGVFLEPTTRRHLWVRGSVGLAHSARSSVINTHDNSQTFSKVRPALLHLSPEAFVTGSIY